MSESKPYSLSKTEKLKSRKLINSVFDSGRKISLYPFRLIFNCGVDSVGIKTGFTVSSKNFPRAVDRNRIKRLMRESFRTTNAELKENVILKNSALHLFFIYTGKEILPYEEISKKMKLVLTRLIRDLYAENFQNT